MAASVVLIQLKTSNVARCGHPANKVHSLTGGVSSHSARKISGLFHDSAGLLYISLAVLFFFFLDAMKSLSACRNRGHATIK